MTRRAKVPAAISLTIIRLITLITASSISDMTWIYPFFMQLIFFLVDNMWVDMIYSGCAQTIIFLITWKFVESNVYSLTLNDGPVSCVNITDGHWIVSAVDCGLHASRNELYHHGFVYNDGHCHLCRSNNSNCGRSSEGDMMSGPHHIEGEFGATEQLCHHPPPFSRNPYMYLLAGCI